MTTRDDSSLPPQVLRGGPPPGPGVYGTGPGPRSAEPESAEACLLLALRAKSLEEREKMASRGLSRGSDDPELIALLLRQLYLVRMEEQNYTEALRLASEMVDLEELGDIARQDAARAAIGLMDYETAIGHLRVAARISPADRRAFHLATLGALLRFTGHAKEAAATLGKATRWAQKDRALYRAQEALATHEAGLEQDVDWLKLRKELESMDGVRGYTLCVLGELCALLGDRAASRDYLERFLKRLEGAPPIKQLALKGELGRARALLLELSA